ncbi:GtrA family protein [Microbacterium sp.]|uniref:GtrA family protein n=1 Tax=Microbacterium sp. TaxID=51671 RepID=UPI003F6E8E04
MTASAPPPRAGFVARIWAMSAVRYLVVGGLCFVIDVALLWLAYDVIGIPLAIATPIAFLASFATTYSLQRILAFASDAKVVPSVGKYTALVVFNTLATTAIVWGVAELGGGWLIGKVAAVIATTVWNFFAYRYWVFATPEIEARDV